MNPIRRELRAMWTDRQVFRVWKKTFAGCRRHGFEPHAALNLANSAAVAERQKREVGRG